MTAIALYELLMAWGNWWIESRAECRSGDPSNKFLMDGQVQRQHLLALP
jgi:hypothetical protein